MISHIQFGLENLEYAAKHISDRYAAITGCISNNITTNFISCIQFGIDSLKNALNQLSVGFAAYRSCLSNNLYIIAAKFYGVKPYIYIKDHCNICASFKSNSGNQNALLLTKGFDANQKALRGPNIKLLAGRDTFIKQTSSYVEISNLLSQILSRVSPTPVNVENGNAPNLCLL